MMCSRLGNILVLIACAVVCGCQGPKVSSEASVQNVPDSEHPKDLKQHIRNNCASLLYDLLNDERHVSKLLIIKRESRELSELVKKISATAGNQVRQLEQLARADQTLDLQVTSLPSGEVTAREAIAKTKVQDLLRAKGADFQWKLLLTQTEALSYGTHLAQVAAENESDAKVATVFSQVQQSLGGLHEEVLALLSRTITAIPEKQAQSRW